MGSIPASGRSLGEGNGNLFQYSCLENPMDRGACQAIVLGVAKSQTRLSTHVLHCTVCSESRYTCCALGTYLLQMILFL